MDKNSQTLSRRNKWLLGVLTPCLVLAVGTGWLGASTSGLQWLLGVVERQSGGNFNAEGISGSLLDSFGMQQLVLRGDGWRITLQDAQLEWHPPALLRGQLYVLHLSVRQVDVLTLPSGKLPALPDSLRLPLDVSVLQMKLDSLRVYSREGATPDFSANVIEARFESDGRHHRLQELHARLPFGDIAGSGEIALDKPYALKAQAALDTAMQFSGQSERVHFVADASGDLQHISVKLDGNGAGMSVNGAAQLALFSAIPVSRVQAAFSGMDARRLYEGAPPATLSGSIDLHGTPGGMLEGSVQVRNAHAAPLDQNGLPLLGVTAQVRLSSLRWQLQQLDAQLPNDGHITGTLSWEVSSSKGSAQLKVHDLAISALDTRLPNTRLQGDITLDGAGGDLHAVAALGDGKLDVYGELKRQGGQVELSDMRLTRGETVLSGHGRLALDRRRTFRFISQLRKLNLSEFAATPRTELNANLDVSGALLPEVGGKLQFDLSNSHFAQYDISGNGHLNFAGLRQATGEIEMRLGDNHLNLEVEHGTQSDRVKLMLDAPNLAQLGSGLGGQLAGSADLSGSLTAPELNFLLEGKDIVLPDGQSIGQVAATGSLREDAVHLQIGVTGYRSEGELNIPEASLELNGSRAQHTIRAFSRIAQGQEALGELSLSASGGFSDPLQGWQTLQWYGELDELAANGVAPFHLVSSVPLTLAAGSVHLGAAELVIGGGHVNFSDSLWTQKRWHSTGHFSGLNVRAMNVLHDKHMMDAIDPMRFGGSWEVTADEHWQGSLQVQLESGDWVVDGNTGLQLGLRDMQLSLCAEHDQLEARLAASGERLGEMAVQASVPLSHRDAGWTILPDAPLAGYLHLHSDNLSWLGPALDSNLQSGGRLNLDADLLGTFLAPRLQGAVHGEALSLALLDQGIRLEQGQLAARFEPDAMHIDRFVFTAPYQTPPRDRLLDKYKLVGSGGLLSASGRIGLEGDSGELQITAERLPLAQRADRWIIASGTGNARYANHMLTLGGNIRADAGLINQSISDRPRWSDDVQIIGQEPAVRPGPPNTVDATLDLGDHFYIRASGLEARLAGQLNIHGEPGKPLHVTGIIAAQDALFDAYGQRLQVERGLVNFQGPLDDPGLNILALRKGLSVEAGVEVTGTVRHPTVRLVSTPNVLDAEKLSWIVLGRVPESTGIDTSLLLAAAGNILGGQSVGQIGRTLGVDELSLRQKETGDALQTQVVTVGKRLSSRAYLSYEQGLSDVGGVTKFIYTLTPRITIVTRTGTEDALDLFYSFRFY